MSGGDNRPNGGINLGIDDAVIYDTQTDSLSHAADMSSARWYPTSTVLPNGDILISGGIDGAGLSVTTPEVYSPATNQWRSLLGISTEDYYYFYPRQWVAPNGLIFGYTSDTKMYYMDTNGNGSLQPLGTRDTIGNSSQGTAVMYRPGKILQVGGTGSVTNDAAVIDINGETPSVRPVARPAEFGRIWANSVVLPNGEVMIVGGSAQENELIDTSFRPEIWNPIMENWALMAPAVKARLYHSTALLLKDGRVLVAGGGAPGPQVNLNAEIFSPPYLFNTAGEPSLRPTIVKAPTEAPYTAKIAVRHKPVDVISRVTLIKTGAVTHSFNMEQRFLELDFESIHNGVSVTLPDSANLAPPGYYLLHLLDDNGVPSEAHMIRLSSTAELNIGPFPIALEDTATSDFGATITVDVLANDTANEKGLVTVNEYSQQGGRAILSANKIIYTPKTGFSGTDVFWYVMEDDQGRTNSAKVTVAVTPDGPVPTAMPDYISTTSSELVTIDALANDTGLGLSLNALNPWSQQGGNVALVNNKITYTSKTGFSGVDKIWYDFKDNQGRSNFGEIQIEVIAIVDDSDSESSTVETDDASTDNTHSNVNEPETITNNRGGGSFSWLALMFLFLFCLMIFSKRCLFKNTRKNFSLV